jgi:hypothetical protein
MLWIGLFVMAFGLYQSIKKTVTALDDLKFLEEYLDNFIQIIEEKEAIEYWDIPEKTINRDSWGYCSNFVDRACEVTGPMCVMARYGNYQNYQLLLNFFITPGFNEVNYNTLKHMLIRSRQRYLDRISELYRRIFNPMCWVGASTEFVLDWFYQYNLIPSILQGSWLGRVTSFIIDVVSLIGIFYTLASGWTQGNAWLQTAWNWVKHLVW